MKKGKKAKKETEARLMYVSPAYRVFTIINDILLVILAALCIIPFIHILAVSFSDAASSMEEAYDFTVTVAVVILFSVLLPVFSMTIYFSG